MNQTLISRDESPLFDNAISKLQPSAFSHPVWIRFGYIEDSYPYDATIKSLQAEIENLRKEHPSDACQVFLLCAVFQHYSGQSTEALVTVQAAKKLAKKNDLHQEIMWALWGASAICIQQKEFQQATTHLGSLIRLLRDQDDWILASFVEEVKQALQPGDTSGGPEIGGSLGNQLSGNLLESTFHWLNHWGFSTQNPGRNLSTAHNRHDSNQTQPLFSWRSLILIFNGELKINWLGHRHRQGKSQFSFFGFIQSLLHINLTSQENRSEIIDTATKVQMGLETYLPDDRSSEIIENPRVDVSPIECLTSDSNTLQETFPCIPISVHMLGNFTVTIQESNLMLPSSRSLSLFKYLLLHHKQNTPREVLMDVFWPDAEPETARNNLNVAVHSLRRAIRSMIFLPFIVFKDGGYGFESNVEVWLDIEEFERCVKAGERFEARNQLSTAVSQYEAAISLYQGDFLEQNPYEEWTVLDRERLRIAYLDTLDRLSQIYFKEERYSACRSACQLILARDPCREDAHCLLMQCYSRQGQPHLALYQYQVCVEALRGELQVEPAPETTQLYNRIRRREHV